MSKKTRNKNLSIESLVIGYEQFGIDLSDLEADVVTLPQYPPFDLKKTDEDSYVLDVALAGYRKEDIKAWVENNVLWIECSEIPQAPEDVDDQFLHHGIYAGGRVKCKFLVSPKLVPTKAEYVDGRLEITFDPLNQESFRMEIPIGPFLQEVKPYIVEYNSAGEPVSSIVEEIKELPVIEDNVILVNANNPSIPTTEITLPDPLPPIVEIILENVEATPDTATIEPQASIVVVPATYEISDNVVTDVIKTEAGYSDIVVAIDEEVKQILEDRGIDPVADVAAAIEKSDIEYPELLPSVEMVETIPVEVTADNGDLKVNVEVPEVLPQIVSVEVTENPLTYDSNGSPTTFDPPTIELKDVSEDIPVDHSVVPIVTAEGSPDVVVTISPENQTKLDNASVTVEDITTAIVQAQPDIDTTTLAVPAEPETTVVVNNVNDTTVPTVEVTMPVEMPQIVQVQLDHVEPVVDAVSSEPQVSVSLSDATYEVSDNVELVSVPTDQGSSDIIVAVPVEVKVELEQHGVDVVEEVTNAIQTADIVAPELPPVVDVESTTVTTSEVSVEVPDVVSQVVEATVDVTTTPPSIVLSDVSENVPADSTLVPVVTAEGQNDVVVAISDSDVAALEQQGVVVADVISEALIKNDTEVVATTDVAPVSVESAEQPSVVEQLPDPIVSVVVNAEDTTVPTTEVNIPDPVPQIVEVTLEEVKAQIDPVSSEPQAVIVVSDAVHELSDDVTTTVVTTEPGKADIVVAVSEETQKVADQAGIDIIADIKQSIAQADVASPELPVVENVEQTTVTVVSETNEPSPLTVTTPEVITPVVELTIDPELATTEAPSVVLSDSSEQVSPTAELIPVVTAEGQNDVVIAVEPEVKAELESKGVDIAADVSAALIQANVEVSPPGEISS